jgi:glycosyltransferase involved in cell wall biosynthesis
MNSAAPGVLFIVNSLDAGGAEKQVVTLLNNLDAGRFRLHLAYLKRLERLLPQVRHERLHALTCCDAGRGFDVGAFRRLLRLVTETQIDLIVCTNTYSLLYGYLVRLVSRRPLKLLAVFHTTLLRSAKQRLQMQLYRRLFTSCDLLIYVCENQRLYWRKGGLLAADAVIHNGIDVEFFRDAFTSEQKSAMRTRLGFDSADYVIGLCSGLRPEKSHGDLLQAVARLRSAGVRAKALLIGDGPERPAIERLARELRIVDHVRITGTQTDVRPYVACCDVMTLVSHSIETFSLAALESMALRKPLVMSDIGGASELILHGESGFLFQPGDIDTLVQHLTSLASEGLRVQLGGAAAERVRRLFTLERMVTGFESRISSVLERGASRA